MAETQAPQQEDITLQFSLKISEINMALNALAELPFKMTVELINNIKGQAQEQINALQAAQQEAPPAE